MQPAMIHRAVSPPPGHANTVLVFLCGLLGNYRAGLEALRRLLFEHNHHIHFDCALLTSRQTMCSMKELAAQRCSCDADDAAYAAEDAIRILAQHCPLVYSDFRENAVKHCDFYNRINTCYGVPHNIKPLPANVKPMFQFRLAHGLRMALEAGRVALGAYSHFLALRPDVVLTRPLAIKHVCSTHTGFNVIGGEKERAMHFHTRDWDLALLACEPASMQLWLQPYLDNNASKRCARGASPPKPEVFRGAWNPMLTGPLWGVARYECAAVALFRERGMRLGTLDDAAIFVTLPEWRLPQLDDPCSTGEFGVLEGALYTNRTLRNRTRYAPLRSRYG